MTIEDRAPGQSRALERNSGNKRPIPKSGVAGHCTFTVFIPAFNRAHTLPKALESLVNQTFADFEVVVVDDGSTDGTGALIEAWRQRASFPIKYCYQENRGKPSAHNRALEMAEGTFFMTLDSDDSMLPDALEKILEHWEQIPPGDRDRFAGVCGLCLKDSGLLSGSPYPQNTLDSDYLSVSRSHDLRGEKREALRTDILRQYRYPIIEGEKHIRPSLVLRRLSLRYRIRFINVPLQINRHGPDGIMAHRFRYRMRNPKGLRLCFYEEITIFDGYSSRKKLHRNTVRYIRYSLHSGVGLARQAREVKHVRRWLQALPEGVSSWLMDELRKRGRKL